jgi:hypothetical protein
MFVTSHVRKQMADMPETRSSVHVPMVYEKVDTQPMQWQYHVLKIDTREEPLPDADQLNTLGHDGWILTGMLDERATGKSAFVYYYFVRQK